MTDILNVTNNISTLKSATVSGGLAHDLPDEIKNTLTSNIHVFQVWQKISPIARNEWLCWVEAAKQQATRARRINIMLDKLSRGDKRPCCWPGCKHR